MEALATGVVTPNARAGEPSRLRRALAWITSFGPSPRLAHWLGATVLVITAGAFAPALAVIGIVMTLLVTVIALFDLRRTCDPARLRTTREHEPVMSHGARHTVRLSFENPTARPALIELEEVWPPTVSPERIQLSVLVPAFGHAEASYSITPQHRGAFFAAPAAVRCASSLGLGFRQRPALVASTAVHVYPDIRGIARYELAARRHLVGQIGIRSVRRRGSGTEIEGLRDYVPDDEYRRIDWKATARRGRPVTRELRDEQAQTVYILLDAGRLGAVPMGGATRLDFAVNAALVLAHVAAVHGDRVGLLVFDREVRRHFAPLRASRAIVPRLARLLYDVAPALVESDYGAAFDYLAVHHRRRGLVVLFSDVLSVTASQPLIAHLGGSVRRHLPLCVAIDDPAVRDAATLPLTSARDVYHLAAAGELRRERAEALRAMGQRGILTLDVPPSDATPTVISRYLALKAQRRL
ncbi:MAG TPA: DUF58 domain-containing protein [Polyangia bacterium]